MLRVQASSVNQTSGKMEVASNSRCQFPFVLFQGLQVGAKEEEEKEDWEARETDRERG